MTSRWTGNVYIADPSHTVSGGTPTPLATASFVVLPPSDGGRPRSVGAINCFLYSGMLWVTHTNNIGAASNDG
jgi:hypothetical protein